MSKRGDKLIEGVVHKLCRYIEENADTPLKLTDLEKISGYSSAHIQKAFSALVGCSPKKYHSSIRSGKFKKDLKSAKSLSDSIYKAGYGSPSRVYEGLSSNLGMTPKEYKRGAKEIEINYAPAKTSLGLIVIAATDRGICFLQFGKNLKELLAELKKEFPEARLGLMPKKGMSQFKAWIENLNQYLSSKGKLRKLPLDIQGTALQIAVWRYLQKIPEGEVRSYSEVAKAVGKPKAVRAVATCCAKNRIGILIPCHRVIRGNGDLAGYRWGLERKRELLRRESES